MVAEGFVPLANEWWHYDWRDWRAFLPGLAFNDPQRVSVDAGR